MSESTICYFGFGSLVNRETRPENEPAVAATLQGWERQWAHHALGFGTDSRSCCSLTVKPMEHKQASIDGVLVTLDAEDLPELDKRETGYDRVELPAASFSLVHPSASDSGVTAPTVYMYVSKPEQTAPANESYPILQSYIDCVMAGYESLFGQEGLNRFMSSTQGWHGPIENDRAQPRYPRSVSLASSVLARYDVLIEQARNTQAK